MATLVNHCSHLPPSLMPSQRGLSFFPFYCLCCLPGDLPLLALRRCHTCLVLPQDQGQSLPFLSKIQIFPSFSGLGPLKFSSKTVSDRPTCQLTLGEQWWASLNSCNDLAFPGSGPGPGHIYTQTQARRKTESRPGPTSLNQLHSPRCCHRAKEELGESVWSPCLYFSCSTLRTENPGH